MEGLGINCHNLGELYLKQGLKDEASKYLNRALTVFEQLKSLHKQETEALLVKLEELQI